VTTTDEVLAEIAAAAETAHVAPRVPPALPKAPTGWEPGVRYDPATALPTEVTTEQVAQDVQGTPEAWADLIRHLLPMVPDGHEVRLVEARYDPVAWTRDTPRDTNGWTTPATTRPAWRYRFRIVPTEHLPERVDVTELVKVIRGNRKARPRKTTTARTRVVVLSDAQIGKVDHRGGTQNLLERIDTLLDALDDETKTVRCDDAVILDPGDLAEGFENTPQQAHTNDLSHPAQLEVAEIVLTQAVGRISGRHTRTRVASVPSNHTLWRRGKDRLGRPGDDYGLKTHRTVARAMALAGRDDVTWLLPEAWEESLVLQVRGAVIGLAHGHQVPRPDGIRDWWAKQTHGGGPLAAATILVTGHYHHLRVEPTGAIDGRSRWWFQAPTLDNGSSWYRNGGGGGDSEPGLLTFTVDDDGRWDNLRLLTP